MTRLHSLGFLAFFSACASSSVRAPAQVGVAVPWVPGTNANPSVPYAPPGHAAAPTQQPASPQQPTNSDLVASVASCKLRLDQVPIGGGYSVMSLLTNAGNWGTFTGNWAADQAILRPWFANSAPGSAIFDAARASQAYFRAIQYVNGNHSDLRGKLTWQDYQVGSRMAAVLVSIMATGSDVECTRFVRLWGNRILGPYAAELDESRVPAVAAADLIRDNRLKQGFNDIDQRRQDLLQRIRQQEELIKAKERENESARLSLQSQLNNRYADLRAELLRVPPCRDTVQFQLLTGTDGNTLKDKAQNLVSTCLDAIRSKLTKLHDDEVALVNRGTHIVTRGGAEFQGSERSRLAERLEAVQAQTRKYQQYEAMLTQRTDDSITTHIDKLDELLKNRDMLAKNQNLAPEVQKRNELHEQLSALSSRWLTYGYFGGFALPNSGQ